MSRRFGRNQRRAARERIAELEAQIVAERHRGEEKRRLAEAAGEDRLRRMVEELGRALGRNFFGLPVTMAVAAACEIGHLDSDDGFRYSLEGGRIATMHPVRIAMDLDSYQMRAHVRVKLGPARATYAISERALLHVPMDALAERIGRELAELIVTHFRKLRSGR